MSETVGQDGQSMHRSCVVSSAFSFLPSHCHVQGSVLVAGEVVSNGGFR